MAPLVPPEPCQARRGLDYLTAVFVSVTNRHHQETFDFCRALVADIHPCVDWEERPRPPYFELAFASTIGCRIETTPPGTGSGRNEGYTSLSLPGAFFYLQSDADLVVSLDRLTSREGLKRFSRLDFMVTELEPDWPAERVALAVREKRLWVAGHRTVREWSERDFDGVATQGLTLYWGSKKSDRQGRTYDKGAQSGWPVPAIRDEVQLRGEWAHTYGRQLIEAVKNNLGTEAVTRAIDSLGSGALVQHMDYWNTNGADPKKDIHWKRKAEPADWYRRRLSLPTAPLRKDVPEGLDEEAAYQHFLRTYGAIVFRHWFLECQKPGVGALRATMRHFGECAARLKPDQFEEILQGVPEADRAGLRQELSGILDSLAREREYGAQ